MHLIPYRSGEIAEMNDANKLTDIMRKADAICKMFEVGRHNEDEHIPEEKARMLKLRNIALRRLGVMYNSIDNKGGRPKTSSDPSDVLTRPQFADSLGLTPTEVMKIRSLAQFDDDQFELYADCGGDILWITAGEKKLGEPTIYGQRLIRDRKRIKDALRAKQRENERLNPVTSPVPSEARQPEPMPSYEPDEIEPTGREPVTPIQPTRDPEVGIANFVVQKMNELRGTSLDRADMTKLPTEAREQLFDEIDITIGWLSDLQNSLRKVA